MTTKSHLKRVREALLPDNITEFDNNISEDDGLYSDPDYSISETESDDTSTDECISKEDDSSDSSNSYMSDDDINIDTQPESIKKDGITWSTEKTTAPGRFRAVNILKKKPGPVTKIQTMVDAFKLFITNDILDEVILQTNIYARRHFEQQNQKRLDVGTFQRKMTK